MNEVELTPVTLPGRGFCYKPGGNYLPGEYAALDNLDISNDGTIIGRKALTFSALGATAVLTMRKFLGTYKDRPISCSNGSLYQQRYDVILDEFNRELLPGTSSGGTLAVMPAVVGVLGTIVFNYTQFEGFWNYNGFNYLLLLHTTLSSAVAGANTNYRLNMRLVVLRTPMYRLVGGVTVEEIQFNSAPTAVVINDRVDTGTYTTASGIPQAIYTGINDWPTHYVKNHFIYKERVWVATEDTLFASKATDPVVWAPPDGYFIKFPKQEIKDVIPLSSNIYILCDSVIYAFGYELDPNLDAQNILVSDSLGGESGVAVGDTVYFIKDDSLYGLVGTNTEKALDLMIDEDLTPPSATFSYAPKLAWYEDALYLIPRRVRGRENVADNGYKGENAYYDGVSEYCYRISLDNQSVSRITVSKEFSLLNGVVLAKPVDAMFVPVEGIRNQNFLFIMFQSALPRNDNYVAYIEQNRSSANNEFIDKIPAWPSLTATQKMAPELKAIVQDWSPDGLKYFAKKFRQVLLTADLSETYDTTPNPLTRLLVYAGTVDTAVDVHGITSVPLLDMPLKQRAGRPNSNVGYRFGVNQRAAVLTLQIQRDAGFQADGVTSDSRIEISDIRVAWMSTRRAPTDNVNDVT